jgi:hypothetical protein
MKSTEGAYMHVMVGLMLTSAGRFVVEEDSIHDEHAVFFAVVDGRPMCEGFGRCVWRCWSEGRQFILDFRARLAEEFGRAGLERAALLAGHKEYLY